MLQIKKKLLLSWLLFKSILLIGWWHLKYTFEIAQFIKNLEQKYQEKMDPRIINAYDSIASPR
jgi:hypothetical protein